MQRNTISQIVTLLVTFLAASTMPAASQVSADEPALLVDQTSSGSLWVSGRTYKASFDPLGATFIPFLGSAAPRNHPLALRLEEARVGERALEFDRRAPALRAGAEVRYDRGALEEFYRLADDSVEQAFLLPEVPAGGDLVLRIAFESELGPVLDSDGIFFGGPHGGVCYGQAVAYDASGRSVAAPLALREGGIEIRVSETFLAGAKRPILVDPVIQSRSIDASPAVDRFADIAYDASLDRYLVCWERSFSGSDSDAIARVLDGSGATLHVLPIAISGQDEPSPSVGCIDALDQFLVVTRTNPGGPPASHLTGRFVDLGAGPPAVSAPVEWLHTGAYLRDHDVGGDAGTSGALGYCLALGEDMLSCVSVRFLVIDPAGAPVASHTWSGDCDFRYLRPRVSKLAVGSLAGPRTWAIAFEDEWLGVYIRSHTLTTDGVLLGGATIAIPQTGSAPSLQSVCMIAPDRYLVAWQNTSGVDRILARMVQGSVPGPTLTLSSMPTLDCRDAAVDSDGESVVATYVQSAGMGGNPTVEGVAHAVFEGDLFLSERARISNGAPSGAATTLVSARGSLPASDRYFAVWHQESASFDIEGALYEAPGEIERYCLGGLNSQNQRASIHPLGSLRIQDDGFGLRAGGCPPNQPGLFILGLGQQMVPFGEGFRCVGPPAVRIPPIVMTDLQGTAAVQLDLNAPYGAFVTPGPPGVNYQFWYRDPAGGPSGINLSDAIRVEHTP